MKIEVFVDTDEYANVEWPEGLPLPNVGDFVLMQIGKASIGFDVTERHFGIGTGIDGQPLARVRIKGVRPSATP